MKITICLLEIIKLKNQIFLSNMYGLYNQTVFVMVRSRSGSKI